MSDFSKLLLDADQLTMYQSLSNGIDISENGLALNALRETGPGKHFLGSQHTQKNFETAFWRSELSDNKTYEQWTSEGEVESELRARQKAVEMLKRYENPVLEKSIEEELRDFINHKNETLPDSEY